MVNQNMMIEYFPTNGIAVNGILIEFKESRNSVRGKLLDNYIENNQVIDVGYGMEPISQRRDIYENLNATKNFFFLGYDENDLLSEIEVHQCDQIKALDVVFSFDDELDAIALALSKRTSLTRKGDGECFFKEANFFISDKQQMGAEGTTLGYFYCASDVTHLEDLSS